MMDSTLLQKMVVRYFSTGYRPVLSAGRKEARDQETSCSEALHNGFLFVNNVAATLNGTGFSGDMVSGDLYGHYGNVMFVLMYDSSPSRPVLHNMDMAVRELMKQCPEANLDQALWAYEDRTRGAHAEAQVYFFRTTLTEGAELRKPVGNLPRRLVGAFLNSQDWSIAPESSRAAKDVLGEKKGRFERSPSSKETGSSSGVQEANPLPAEIVPVPCNKNTHQGATELLQLLPA